MTAADPVISKGAQSLPLFLAHALRLESEAIARYGELATAMDAHNQPEVAGLFREMAVYAALHHHEIASIAATLGPLPRLAAWEFDWGGADDSPEAADWDATHYLMTAHHALHAALACERNAHRYYAEMAASTAEAEVARLAADFAEEEAGHAALLTQWLPRYPAPDAGWDHDPDPPNSVD